MSAATAGSTTRIWRSGPSIGTSRRCSISWRCCRASLQRNRLSDRGSNRVPPRRQSLRQSLLRLPNGDGRRKPQRAPPPRRLHDHRSLERRAVRLPSRGIVTRIPLRFHHTLLNGTSRKRSIHHQAPDMARPRAGNSRAPRGRTTWARQRQARGLLNLRLQSQATICALTRLAVPSVP